MLGIQLHRWSSEISSGAHSFWEWLDRALQVYILCYEEWSWWSKFQASKKPSLDFCFKKRSASLTATKLASRRRTSPPPFLSLLDLCWWLTILMILLLSLFFSWQTSHFSYLKLCWVLGLCRHSLFSCLSFFAVKSLVVRCLRNEWMSSWWVFKDSPTDVRCDTTPFLSNSTVTNTDGLYNYAGSNDRKSCNSPVLG